MRKDHYSSPAKWTREFRQALKLSDAHFKVYSYLESGLESHATGIFFVTRSAVAEMVMEDDRDNVARIMGDLEEFGLILWDDNADVVYVPCVCPEQFRWTGKAKTDPTRDYRLIEAKRHIASLPKSNLVELFLSRWPIFKPDEGAMQGASQGAIQAPAQAPTPSTCSFSPAITLPQTPRRAAEQKNPMPVQDENGLDLEVAS